MSEGKQFRDVMIKIGIIVLLAFLYALGGYEGGPGKWVRRILMPLLFGGTLFWFSRDWKSLIAMPLVGIGTSLGYGADETFLKIIKRTYCGLLLGAGSAAGDWLNRNFLIAAFQTLVVTSAMVVFGVWNVLPDARTEEFVIGLLIVFIPIMSARRRI